MSGGGRGESFIRYTAIIYYVPNPEKEKAYLEEQVRIKQEAEKEEKHRLTGRYQKKLNNNETVKVLIYLILI